MGQVSLSTPLAFAATPDGPSSPGFGVRPDGSAYFDPRGAQPGEAAVLFMDSLGRLYLEYEGETVSDEQLSGGTGTFSLEAPTFAIREKPNGTSHTPPMLRSPEIRSGRPVAILAMAVSPACKGCGAPLTENGWCRACEEQKQVRKINRLLARETPEAEIAEKCKLTVLQVQHLIRKGRRTLAARGG